MLRRVGKEVEDQSKHGIITLPEGEIERGWTGSMPRITQKIERGQQAVCGEWVITPPFWLRLWFYEYVLVPTIRVLLKETSTQLL